MMAVPLRADHLIHLAGPWGIHEHALLTEARPEHGYCVDDMARVLVVAARAEPAPQVQVLIEQSLSFLLAAQHDDGLSHNRRHPDGSWGDAATSDDHWGRALWALGTAYAELDDPVERARANDGVERAMRARSRWPRATAYAVLGAAQVLRRDPDDRAARRLLLDARPLLAKVATAPEWPWPEQRLTYANAVLPEAMIVLGTTLGEPALRAQGLMLLGWLLDLQTSDEHLSVVPVAGLGRHDARGGFDQQPIEVACLAEACRTAYDATGDERWAQALVLCRTWFDGANDVGLVMHDEASGGGFDGLEDGSVNANQGAESTLAWLSTVQCCEVARADALAATR
jgi:hypothetical protein